MTHDEFLNLLSARLDGELSPENQAALEEHLRDNPDARATEEAFRSQDGELRSAFAGRRRAARKVAAKVKRQMANPPKPARKFPRWAWLPIIGTIVAVVVVGVVLLDDDGPPPPNPRPFPNGPIVVDQDLRDRLSAMALGGLRARTAPLAPKSILAHSGETLRTEAGQKLRRQLPDGSILCLNSESQATVEGDRRVRLLKGEAYLEIQPVRPDLDGPGPGGPMGPGFGMGPGGGMGPGFGGPPPVQDFVLLTPGHAFISTATRFDVSLSEKDPTLIVAQGKVAVSRSFGPIESPSIPTQVDVSSGQMFTIGMESPANVGGTAPLLSWTRELVIASETPLIPAPKHAGGSLVAVDPYGQEAKLSLEKFHIDIHIEDGFARTTIDQTYFNSENFDLEGTFYFPLPPDASLSRLAMYVDGNLMEGGMAEREHARRTYEQIRYAQRDPALLEWVDGSTFKMRVFPLEARRQKRLILSYTQRLEVAAGRTTYRFPAGHTLNNVEDWSYEARVRFGSGLDVKSPSHPKTKTKSDGTDLLLNDTAKNIKPDRDIVLEIPEAKGLLPTRWSEMAQDGQRYLMLRHRPDLRNLPQRQRRDWVFVSESAGNRDPLLARTQIEIIRQLLEQAEPEDTFSLLTAGTRVHAFSPNPLPVNRETIADAIRWLEMSHLIGALDLDKAFSTAAQILATSQSPHLVYVGSGIPSLGEQRPDKLLAKIPPETKFVGIAVGKKYSLPILQKAAEQTGGYFTRINPDESITWRCTELTSTLNTPRILNAKVEVAGDKTRKFLLIENSVANGGELVALTRLDSEAALPKQVVLRAILDGADYAEELAVNTIAPNAAYLPRTWAKLEIDRLLATPTEDDLRNKVVELSKAMYVMSPFTSLLVLENEAMYKEFKVDRGRKDHWAMYPCPPKIDIIYRPDPGQPNNPTFTPNLGAQKPHESQVKQSILARSAPEWLTWMDQRQDERPTGTVSELWGDLPSDERRRAFDQIMRVTRRQKSFREIKRANEEMFYEGVNEAISFERTGATRTRFLSSGGGNPEADVIENVTRMVDRVENKPLAKLRSQVELLKSVSPTTSDPADGVLALGVQPDSMEALERFSDRGSDPAPIPDRARLQFSLLPLLDADDKFGIRRLDEARKELQSFDHPGSPVQVTGNRIDAIILEDTKGPQYYSLPRFNTNERIFTDLLSYAPGMSSSAADMQAAVEAEAAPRFGQHKGRIENAARRLFDSVRKPDGWTKSVSEEDKLTILHNATGSFVLDHQLDSGLVEKIICDGDTLWHLYPELGLGAERKVTRFHRESFRSLLPDLLPPIEDLAHGADVRLLDPRTVVVRPHVLPGSENPEWVETRFIIEDRKLISREFRLMPKGQPLGTETYSGQIRITSGSGKEVVLPKRLQTPIMAPDLKPDLSKLVVLQLPLRSRQIVYPKLGFDPAQGLTWAQNRCYEYLTPEAALEILASDLAENNADNVREMCLNRFHRQGDTRIGFRVLLASVGSDPSFDDDLVLRMNAEPENKLVRYLALLQQPQYLWLQARTGILPGNAPEGADFLSRLTRFRELSVRWNSGLVQNRRYHVGTREKANLLNFVERNADNLFGWSAMTFFSEQSGDAAFRRRIADVSGKLADKSAFRYFARYEQAIQLGVAGQQQQGAKLLRELYLSTLRRGIMPSIDTRMVNLLRSGEKDEFTEFMMKVAEAGIKEHLRPLVVQLAWQCRELGQSALAERIFEMVRKDLPDGPIEFLLREPVRMGGIPAPGPASEPGEIPEVPPPGINAETFRTSMVAIEYLCHHQEWSAAGSLLAGILGDFQYSDEPKLWRLASWLEAQQGKKVLEIEFLERALDLEYASLPTVIRLDAVRHDYGRLLSHYEWLSEAAQNLGVSPPPNLLALTVDWVDRWRRLDPESAEVCMRAARIIRKIGEHNGESRNPGPPGTTSPRITELSELAWEYLTTPIAQKPNESEPWLTLAQEFRRQGNRQQADRCFEAAFLAEPTNAQILWDRASNLQKLGNEAETRRLFEEIRTGDWQPRFQWLKQQAKAMTQGQ